MTPRSDSLASLQPPADALPAKKLSFSPSPRRKKLKHRSSLEFLNDDNNGGDAEEEEAPPRSPSMGSAVSTKSAKRIRKNASATPRSNKHAASSPQKSRLPLKRQISPQSKSKLNGLILVPEKINTVQEQRNYDESADSSDGKRRATKDITQAGERKNEASQNNTAEQHATHSPHKNSKIKDKINQARISRRRKGEGGKKSDDKVHHELDDPSSSVISTSSNSDKDDDGGRGYGGGAIQKCKQPALSSPPHPQKMNSNLELEYGKLAFTKKELEHKMRMQKMDAEKANPWTSSHSTFMGMAVATAAAPTVNVAKGGNLLEAETSNHLQNYEKGPSREDVAFGEMAYQRMMAEHRVTQLMGGGHREMVGRDQGKSPYRGSSQRGEDNSRGYNPEYLDNRRDSSMHASSKRKPKKKRKRRVVETITRVIHEESEEEGSSSTGGGRLFEPQRKRGLTGHRNDAKKSYYGRKNNFSPLGTSKSPYGEYNTYEQSDGESLESEESGRKGSKRYAHDGQSSAERKRSKRKGVTKNRGRHASQPSMLESL